MPVDLPCCKETASEGEMSVDVASERVCYVHCSFCSTILAVSVPCGNLLNVVTVRCGHCANLLSVNIGALLQPSPLQDIQSQKQKSQEYGAEYGSSSKYDRAQMLTNSAGNDHYQTLPIRPPEKRQRVPSAYNRFIKEEIQRIKARNPEISHREAFSAAAKNWAHFPYIHFGLNVDNNKQVMNSDKVITSEGAPKSHGFY